MPVRVTGLTFYDHDHGQTGRAMNGVEIHPVIDIVFNPVPTPPATPPIVTTVALNNPGFESGNQDWSSSVDVINNDTNEPARTGQFKAWLGGYGTPRTDTLSQRVTLPAAATAITLEFFLHISTEEIQNQQFDTLRVRVRRGSNNQILATVRSWSNFQAAPGYHLQTLSLTQFRGQNIRIELIAQEDNGNLTSFVVDDFRIVVE
jgi:hypothetical protein